MEARKNRSLFAVCLITTIVLITTAGTALAAELLRIQPIKHDCGVVDEGVPATMKATVENISGRELHVNSVKTN